MKTIFVAETVPSQNKGEAALMHGIVRSIKEFSEEPVKFYLCSERQALDQKEYGEDVVVIDNVGLIPLENTPAKKLIVFAYRSIFHLLFLFSYKIFRNLSLFIFRDPLWRAYAEADAIIVGHDNAFSKFHIPLILFSKMLGKKVAVYGSTIMPVVLNTALLHKMGRYALNKADLITTREALTYKHLESIGVDKAPLFCTADKAFILKPVEEKDSRELISRLKLDQLNKPVVGVMIVKGSTVYKAAFKDNKFTEEEKYSRHVQEVASALDSIHEEIGGTFVFVPHCIGPGDHLDDRICAEAVKEKMIHKQSVLTPKDELRVTELKGMMTIFDLVVSERTHGGINAATMLVPTLWITHPGDHRTYGIVTDTLDLPECLYNIEYLDHTTLKDKIMETYNNRFPISEKLSERVPYAEKVTMKNGEYFKKYILDR